MGFQVDEYDEDDVVEIDGKVEPDSEPTVVGVGRYASCAAKSDVDPLDIFCFVKTMRSKFIIYFFFVIYPPKKRLF